MKLNRLFAASAMALALWACNGKNGPGEPASGVLTDAAISGVIYTTTSDATERRTGPDGSFDYRIGDSVTFNVGGVRFTAPAAPRMTPAVLAAALYPNDASKAAKATLNLAMLFQTLDDDELPDNGISMPDGLTIQGFALAALEQDPATFAGTLNDNDSITPAGRSAVAPRDAATHYYANELPGTWYLEDAGRLLTLTIDDAAGADRQPRYVIAEAGTPTAAGTGIETGVVDVTPSGKVVLIQQDDSAMTRAEAACPRAYGERNTVSSEVADVGTGTELTLVGDKLRLGLPDGKDASCKAKSLSLSRLKSVKGSMIGTWLEDAYLNERGNAIFGRSVIAPAQQGPSVEYPFNLDDIFQIYIGNKVLYIVLDCEDGQCEDEKNGLIYANYAFDSKTSTVTAGDVLLDTVSLNPGSKPVIVKNAQITFGDSIESDTRRRFSDQAGSGPLIYIDRLLSAFELQGDFKLQSDSTKIP